MHLCVFSEQPFETSCVSSSSSEHPISSLPPAVFPRQSISHSPSPFAHPNSCLSANVKGAAVPIRHVHLLLDFGAYPRGFDPFFSVRYEPHAFRGGDATLRPQARLLHKKNPRGTFLPCRWLSPPTRPYPSASSAHEYGRRHTPPQGRWHVLGKPQARAPPRPGSSRGEEVTRAR